MSLSCHCVYSADTDRQADRQTDRQTDMYLNFESLFGVGDRLGCPEVHVQQDFLEFQKLLVHLEIWLHSNAADIKHHRVRVVPDAAHQSIAEVTG